jgi:hypothetical protein
MSCDGETGCGDSGGEGDSGGPSCLGMGFVGQVPRWACCPSLSPDLGPRRPSFAWAIIQSPICINDMFTSTIPATKNGQENIFGCLTRRIRRHGEFSAGEHPWCSTRTAGLGGAGGAPRSRRALELRGARRDHHCPFLREDESWTSCNHFLASPTPTGTTAVAAARAPRCPHRGARSPSLAPPARPGVTMPWRRTRRLSLFVPPTHNHLHCLVKG